MPYKKKKCKYCKDLFIPECTRTEVCRKKICQAKKEKDAILKIRQWQRNNPQRVKDAYNRYRLSEKGKATIRANRMNQKAR